MILKPIIYQVYLISLSGVNILIWIKVAMMAFTERRFYAEKLPLFLNIDSLNPQTNCENETQYLLKSKHFGSGILSCQELLERMYTVM